jgi:hypothetical protein
MKSPDFTLIYEPTVAVIPPELADRIRSHYRRRIRHGNISRRALEPLWRRFFDDQAFSNRLMSLTLELGDVIFDPDNPSWGKFWPIDIEECTIIAFILGIIFETHAERIVADLPEEFLASIEAKSRAESRGLCDLLLDKLTERKEAAGQRGGQA